MRVRDIVLEDFVNYKKPSMFINMGMCNWKCCIEQGLDISICQNSELAQVEEKDIDNDKIIDMYLSNPITQAIVIGGLEPFTYTYGLYKFIMNFRRVSDDDIVIYTGYTPEELYKELSLLSYFDNIIIKFGRYIPNQKSHFDEVLGINLVSNNQYATYLDAKLLNSIDISKLKDS